MDGYLLVDKPSGWTSFDVVAKVRGILQREKRAVHDAQGYCQDERSGHNGKAQCRCKIKVGHTGTLDPMATGLLVIMVGKYTKKAQGLIKLDKTYETQLTLGSTSSTGDSEGELLGVSEAIPAEVDVKKVVQSFVGEQMQIPPAYSAIKVKGVRSYKLAREGRAVQLEPRPITIYSINYITYNYPHTAFTTRVGSGTYIRSLCEDIGEALGAGAYMSALRRTSISDFDIKDAISPEQATLASLKQLA